MMQVLPSNGLEVLEFDKVLELLTGECLSAQAKAMARQIRPLTDFERIDFELDLIATIQQFHADGHMLITRSFDTLGEIVRQLAVPGYVLDGGQLTTIRRLLLLSVKIKSVFEDEEIAESYPNILTLVNPLFDWEGISKQITGILGDEGEILPDASPTLRAIIRQIEECQQRINKMFDKVVRAYTKRGMLTDTSESVRNGRRVLAVKSEYKRALRGIVHDQSATGKTTFVEPEEMIEVNNDLVDLNAARRAEEYRLLKMLCEELRPHTEEIADTERQLVNIDLANGKARLAARMAAFRPAIQHEPALAIKAAVHPLLYLKNTAESKETVPFDLHLYGKNRVLLVSGPNAGGKSILMKAVGLLQIMVQSGMPVPHGGDSVFGIYQKLCVELGDRQSLEDELSTYSSRLVDMREFLQVADQKSLVLIDEFGAGTDPKLGGAVAEALLREYLKKGVYGVITTHYSELKAYAYKTRGLVNGAMIFDREKMTPTYQLKVGKPGSSFTFEIAERTGLPEEVVKYARHKAGKHTQALEELIADLERQKAKLDANEQALDQRQKSLDRLVKNYEQLQRDLAAQRKRLKLEKKEQEYFKLSQLNKELEKTIREVREEKNIEKARQQLKKVKSARAQAKTAISTLSESLAERQMTQSAQLKVGDPVRIRNSDQVGLIEQLDAKRATLIIGQMRVTAKRADLLPAGEPLQVNTVRSVQTQVSSPAGSFNSKLDIRGLRPSEATPLLEKFLDEALLANASLLHIVHGKGTGVLKRLVEQKLLEYPVVGVEQPEDQQGGSGVTIVQF